MTTQHKIGIQGMAWLNIVVGALILMTPFLTGDMRAAPLWNGVLVGLLVIGLAGYNAYAANQDHTERVFGPAVTNVVIGLYTLFSAFWIVTSQTYTWAIAAYGVILIAAAGYNAWAASDARGRGARMS